MHIALLPLDERPANTRYPAQIAAIAGAHLVLPPTDALPFMKRRADQQQLADWLSNDLDTCDGIVASVDLLGYGGLIASRIGHDDIATVLQAIDPLTQLRTPARPMFAFNVITRISNANDATEEPDYWAEFGTRLYGYSRELDAQGLERSNPSEMLPPNIVADWLTRRARNHAINMAMLREAALGKFDLLVISSDDTSPIGLSARERKHLEFWCDILSHSPPRGEDGVRGLSQILMYPGADDVGSALVARMINRKRKHAPRVFVQYADESMRNNVAPYEDRPICTAVETQIMAVGAQQARSLDEADVVLVVSPPFERVDGHDPHWPDMDADARRKHLLPTVRQIARWLDEGRRVAVADVAFPNGAEPALVELLFEYTDIAKLAAFGGWNTAGNALGTVLGAACVPCNDDHARQIALAHHLLEDWGYQSSVRAALRAEPLSKQQGEDAWKDAGDVAAFTAANLAPIAQRIANAGLPCTVSQVNHPWLRTFEVDFDLS